MASLRQLNDCSGSFEVKATDAGNVPVDEGDAVTLKLHVDGTGSNYYEVPAIVDRVQVDVDIDEGSIVAYVIDFSGDGAITPHGVLDKSGGGS